VEAELVTAGGDIVVANEDGDAELLWALRGGGGNFGVVTRFDFQLHPFDGRVWTTMLTYSAEDGEAALAALSEVAAAAPRELTLYAWIGAGRAGPLIPDKWSGRPAIMLSAVYVGDPDLGAAVIAPLRAARPIGVFADETTYLALQSRVDESGASGLRRYWKAHFLPALDKDLTAAFLEQGLFAAEESEHVGLELFALGGAVSDIAPGETAFGNRQAEWDFISNATWSDPADDDRVIAVVRRAADAIAPYARGVYANDLGDEGTERIRTAYGDTAYERLVRVKDRLDPGNVFRHNQNVPPASH
jgi:FAD/FMN-containing dehydrogenase